MFQWFKTKAVTPDSSATPYAPPAYEAPKEPPIPPTWEVINRQLTELINQQRKQIERLEEELSCVQPLLDRRNAQFDNILDMAGKALESSQDAKTMASDTSLLVDKHAGRVTALDAELGTYRDRIEKWEKVVQRHDEELGNLFQAVNRITKSLVVPKKKKK